MEDQNISSISNQEKNTPTPTASIPDSISILAVSIGTSQSTRDDPTVESTEKSPNTNEKEASSDENILEFKKNLQVPKSPFSYKSIADLAHSIKQNDYLLEDATITRELGQLTGVTERYIKEKTVTVRRFFEILKKNKSLGFLAEAIQDPQDRHRKTTIFYEHLRGIKTDAKYTILNAAMCWFAINLKKQGKKYNNIKLTDKKWTKEHAEACYESTTTAQRIKELFVEFHEHGIIYGTNDFKKKGGFSNYFTELFDKIKKFRPEFGRLSYSSSFDHNAEAKIRKYGNYKPYENYEDCLQLLIHYTLKYFQLRGRQEPASINCHNWELFTKESGKYAGRECLRLVLDVNVSKNEKLSLKNPYSTDSPEDHEIPSDPEDPLDFVKIFKHYRFKLGPVKPFGRFFRRQAPQKVIDKRRKNNDFTEIDLTSPNGHLGANQFNKYIKRMAIRCHFSKPDRCTAHGKRKEGVSAMVNAKDAVDDEVHRRSSRHKSISSNLRYRIANDTAMDKKFDALLDKGETIKKNNDNVRSNEEVEAVVYNKTNPVENIPDKKLNVSTNIAPFHAQPPQISHVGASSFVPSIFQVQQQPPQVPGPQVLQYAPQPQFVHVPQMQVYNPAIQQPIFQQIAPQYSNPQAPSIYMNGSPYCFQQPQYVAQHPQVQYLHQNIVTSTNTYNDGVNLPTPSAYGNVPQSNQQNFGNQEQK